MQPAETPHFFHGLHRESLFSPHLNSRHADREYVKIDDISANEVIYYG